MKEVKCPNCYDKREVEDKIVLAICKHCFEVMKEVEK